MFYNVFIMNTIKFPSPSNDNSLNALPLERFNMLVTSALRAVDEGRVDDAIDGFSVRDILEAADTRYADLTDPEKESDRLLNVTAEEQRNRVHAALSHLLADDQMRRAA